MSGREWDQAMPTIPAEEEEKVCVVLSITQQRRLRFKAKMAVRQKVAEACAYSAWLAEAHLSAEEEEM